ncbi:MAG: CDP-alcohol phosphatidyltransferase family protein [Bacteroidales bacterium]
MRRQIPNVLTGLNLLLGSVSIPLAFFSVEHAALVIVMAAFLDLFDGMLARKFHAVTSFGQQFDSLADLVSFGLAPSVLIFQMMLHSQNHPGIYAGDIPVFAFPGIFIGLFAGIRLGRFNTAPASSFFSGLPAPAAGLMISSIPLALWLEGERGGFLIEVYMEYYFLLALVIFNCVCMVSSIRMISLKIPLKQLLQYPETITLLAGSVLLLILFRFSGIPLIFIWYALVSAGFGWVR